MLTHGRDLEWAMARSDARAGQASLSGRDRALARAITATVLRRHGQLTAIIGAFVERPLPGNRGRLTAILLAASAQLLFLDTPAHAAIGIAVEQCRRDRGAERFAGLANAVLRKVAGPGRDLLALQDGVTMNLPAWLFDRWSATYGEAAARRIAQASLAEAALDISVKSDPAGWAERLGGQLLPTGSIRCGSGGRVKDRPGYAEGAWWVQDAAAALPARLLGDVAGLRVADLCAAPGGKTAQLAAAGAVVTAVDFAEGRMERMQANLSRLGLGAEIVRADATAWEPNGPFDAVLVDAPCMATGTLRRHPDIPHTKKLGDLDRLMDLQARLLRNASRMVRPGGNLVYCTCSLEPEEGIDQITRFLADAPRFARVAVDPAEFGGGPDWITADGDLRTLPFHMALEPTSLSGLDGFYAARLQLRAV